MKLIFSLILNASILFIIQFLLNTSSFPNTVIITWWEFWWKTYLLWWIILWILNITIKPILKIIWLPLFFIYPIISFFINAIILWLLEKLVNAFSFAPDMKFEIIWNVNFLIAVAIFTFLNILYSILFSK